MGHAIVTVHIYEWPSFAVKYFACARLGSWITDGVVKQLGFFLGDCISSIATDFAGC